MPLCHRRRPPRPRPPRALALVVATTLLLLPVATTTATTTTHGRTLLIADSDPGSFKAYPMDDPKYKYSRDIPLSDPRLRKPGGKGCNAGADGLRLTHWGPGAVLVSFSTCDPVVFPPAPGRPAVEGPAPESKPPPPPPPIAPGEWAVEAWRNKKLVKRVSVDPHFTTQYESHFPDRANGNSYAGGYRSGRLSHVLLDGLTPGETYSYRVVRRQLQQQPAHSSTVSSWESKSPTLAFEAPWPADALSRAASKARGGFYRIGVVGDPGQTPDSARTLDALREKGPRTVVLVGDVSYADDFMADGTPMAGGSIPDPSNWYSIYGEQVFDLKWHTAMRLWSPLASTVPLLTTIGNHDVLSHNFSDFENRVGDYFQAYNAYFPVPDGGGHWSLNTFDKLPPVNAAPPMFAREQLDPVPTSTAHLMQPGAPTNLFYSTEVPGATLLFLTPYIPADFGPGTAQYEFAERVLARVDRKRTPWVVVFTHGNLYSTYVGHFKELECFRLAYEPLFLKHGIDLLVNGHTHAYERFHPSADYKPDPCGIIHITVGDGGNIEGLLGTTGIEEAAVGGSGWTCENYAQREAPNPGGGGRKFNCPSFQPEYSSGRPNGYCWSERPAISAFRKPSFGFGTLDIYNATTAKWTWRANSKQGGRDAPARAPLRDEVWLTRGPEADAKAGCVRVGGGR